jgi:UDP-GlcNAc:undecaprenyl-phosphate GlcNAc-1-phosphate transferase
VATLTAALAGGIFGFIHYNFNPATIFMGDTGSMFIGYMLAAIAILGAVKTAATIALIVPAVALGLPIMDTAFAILRRYSNGKPIFQPDKGHLHHRLLALGLSQKQAVLLMYAISIILSLGAFVLAMANIYIACAVIVLIVIAVAVGAKKIGILRNP